MVLVWGWCWGYYWVYYLLNTLFAYFIGGFCILGGLK